MAGSVRAGLGGVLITEPMVIDMNEAQVRTLKQVRQVVAADLPPLGEVDRAMGTLSGPATACVLRRQRDVFKDARFERMGDISLGPLYHICLRESITLEHLRELATALNDVQALKELNEARAALFKRNAAEGAGHCAPGRLWTCGRSLKT